MAAPSAADERDEAADDNEEMTDAAIAKNIAKLKSMGGSAKNAGKPGGFRKKSSTSKMEVRRPSAAHASGPRPPAGGARSGGPALVAPLWWPRSGGFRSA